MCDVEYHNVIYQSNVLESLTPSQRITAQSANALRMLKPFGAPFVYIFVLGFSLLPSREQTTSFIFGLVGRFYGLRRMHQY